MLLLCCRPDTPDVMHDGPSHISASSSHSSIDNLLSGSPDSAGPPVRADSPSASSSQASLSKHANNRSSPAQPSNVPKQDSWKQQQQQQQQSVFPDHPYSSVSQQSRSPRRHQQQQVHQLHSPLPNPFAAAATGSFSASDSETSLTDLAEASSQPGPASTSLSPKSTRTHIQHALEDGGMEWEIANAAEPMTARMRSSMERAHSAGAWSRPVHHIFPISEDRVMGSSPPKQAEELEHRPIRKVST